uniref:Uncharacterized protein n=1 Tax=Tanacetum cinerariifolium TaxID=118510 RepID=A0A699HB42_TANCI|nr:hypothetical protein [Tanacetum cinerariifolium]
MVSGFSVGGVPSGRCIDMLEALKAAKQSFSLSTGSDVINWDLNYDGTFTVWATRNHIDDVFLLTLPVEINCCKILPRKGSGPNSRPVWCHIESLLVTRTTPLPLGYSNKTNRNKSATLAFMYVFQAEPDPSEFGS